MRYRQQLMSVLCQQLVRHYTMIYAILLFIYHNILYLLISYTYLCFLYYFMREISLMFILSELSYQALYLTNSLYQALYNQLQSSVQTSGDHLYLIGPLFYQLWTPFCPCVYHVIILWLTTGMWSLSCHKFLVVPSTLNDGLFSCQFISKQSSFSTVFTLAFNLVKGQLPTFLRVPSPAPTTSPFRQGLYYIYTQLLPSFHINLYHVHI